MTKKEKTTTNKQTEKILKISIFFLIVSLTSCNKPTYCECEEISQKAIVASAGIPSNVDLDDLEDCGEKIKEDLDFSMPADQIGIDFIQQVSYEMCKNGYYEGKHQNDKGKKYYPKSK